MERIQINSIYAVWRYDEDHYSYISGGDLLKLLEKEETKRLIAGWRYYDHRAPYF